jgi:hypothetical protein
MLAEGAILHRRTVRFLLLTASVALIGCNEGTATPQPSIMAAASGVSMPALRLPGLHRSNATLDADAVALDAVHPDDVHTALDDAGFVTGEERSYTGRRGVFSRVIVRALMFTTPDGAATYLTWLGDHADEYIGDNTPVDTSSDTVVVWHEPSGCCHEETPSSLAALQRGTVVWTVRASGERIHRAPMLELVHQLEREV